MADELYVIKGREGTYTSVLKQWKETCSLFEQLDARYEEYKKQQQTKSSTMRTQIRKLQAIIKKSGNEELITQMEEAIKEQDNASIAE